LSAAREQIGQHLEDARLQFGRLENFARQAKDPDQQREEGAERKKDFPAATNGGKVRSYQKTSRCSLSRGAKTSDYNVTLRANYYDSVASENTLMAFPFAIEDDEKIGKNAFPRAIMLKSLASFISSLDDDR
jgi:hypothetical protein